MNEDLLNGNISYKEEVKQRKEVGNLPCNTSEGIYLTLSHPTIYQAQALHIIDKILKILNNHNIAKAFNGDSAEFIRFMLYKNYSSIFFEENANKIRDKIKQQIITIFFNEEKPIIKKISQEEIKQIFNYSNEEKSIIEERFLTKIKKEIEEKGEYEVSNNFSYYELFIYLKNNNINKIKREILLKEFIGVKNSQYNYYNFYFILKSILKYLSDDRIEEHIRFEIIELLKNIKGNNEKFKNIFYILNHKMNSYIKIFN